MVQTLPEYARDQNDGTLNGAKRQAVIELFPEASDVMKALPYKTAPGGRYGYSEEAGLPSNMGFRAINEVPSEGHGVLNERTEVCYPIAGNIDVDRALLRRYGNERRSRDEKMSIKEKARVWSDTFINGDNQSEPREFTGVKARLQAVGGSVDGTNYESRLFANSAASGGGAMSLSQLDIALGLVDKPTHILMPKILKDRLPAAARAIGVTGHVTQDKDSMGTPITRYNSVEILTGYGITKLGAFLNFNEVAEGGGGAVTSSIYILRMAEDGVCGLQVEPMEVTDMGLLDDGVNMRTNIEWDNGICIEDPYSALRFSSITNAAIVA